MSIREVTDSDFEAAVLASDKPVAVYFWADWCTRCRQLSPIMEEYASQDANALEVVKIDCDRNPRILADYSIMQAPTIAVFRAGKMVKLLTGILSADALATELSDFTQL